MIGVFDSGVGGKNSYKELRRLLPDEKMIYLADRPNAPYGTKDRDTVLKCTRNNIRALKRMGADRILIACCTASSVYHLLDEDDRAGTLPIISPTAAKALTYGERVAVIATEQTVSSHAFREAILGENPRASVTELPTQILVSLVELGARDGELLPREGDLLDKIAKEIRKGSPDSLILGCTHFSSLAGELRERLDGTEIVDAALVGASTLASLVMRDNCREGQDKFTPSCGRLGKVTYTEGSGASRCSSK